ncbi:unnamed protein product [Periconia digitata]|uniref:Uncharacterized protein n=1 Tax=Periconia digitata TaxID=1303443 RepID=A0A9W4XKP3_9PLEO|nr:unnamed protein product [Periconia digitata]
MYFPSITNRLLSPQFKYICDTLEKLLCYMTSVQHNHSFVCLMGTGACGVIYAIPQFCFLNVFFATIGTP